MRSLLEIRDLKVVYHSYQGVVNAVDIDRLDIFQGETLGLVGETGCGKSTAALAILRLIQSPPGKIERGRVIFQERDLLSLDEDEMRNLRGRQIAMIFQDPMASLNPVFTIGSQILRIITLHREGISVQEAEKRAWDVLSLVGLADPPRIMKSYPHELSGGMRQRVMIGMALSCSPALLIADEPTSAVDVTIQAQIMRLLRDLKAKTQLTMLLITHDLSLVAQLCDRVAVMYAGKVVEIGSVNQVYSNPLHPYTQALFKALPTLQAKGKALIPISGTVPSLIDPPLGCRFHPRCPRVMDVCKTSPPRLVEREPGHTVSCFLYGD